MRTHTSVYVRTSVTRRRRKSKQDRVCSIKWNSATGIIFEFIAEQNRPDNRVRGGVPNIATKKKFKEEDAAVVSFVCVMV